MLWLFSQWRQLPAPAKNGEILQRLAEMSKPYGTKMEIEDNIATVVL